MVGGVGCFEEQDVDVIGCWSGGFVGWNWYWIELDEMDWVGVAGWFCIIEEAVKVAHSMTGG